MNIKDQILQNCMEHVYGVLGIENHNKNSTTAHRFWFNHLRENYKCLDGDIFEFGVYQGSHYYRWACCSKNWALTK